VLVAINIVAYIWEVTTGALKSDQALIDHGAIYGPLVHNGQWWRIITGAFLHGGLLHVSLNMFALFQVGTFLEMLVGAPRMLAVYFISMIGSGIAVVLFSQNAVTVGASGAIFGIFGALVAIGLRLGPRGRGLVQQTLPIVLINLAITFSVPIISVAGHLGGLVCGFLAGLVLVAMHQAPVRASDLGPVPEEPQEVERYLPDELVEPAFRAEDAALRETGEEEEAENGDQAPLRGRTEA
jgi:rhomboid protease GluP